MANWDFYVGGLFVFSAEKDRETGQEGGKIPEAAMVTRWLGSHSFDCSELKWDQAPLILA